MRLGIYEPVPNPCHFLRFILPCTVPSPVISSGGCGRINMPIKERHFTDAGCKRRRPNIRQNSASKGERRSVMLIERQACRYRPVIVRAINFRSQLFPIWKWLGEVRKLKLSAIPQAVEAHRFAVKIITLTQFGANEIAFC